MGLVKGFFFLSFFCFDNKSNSKVSSPIYEELIVMTQI